MSSTLAITSLRVCPVPVPSRSRRSNARPSIESEKIIVLNATRRAWCAARPRVIGHPRRGDDVLDLVGEIDHLEVAALDVQKSERHAISATTAIASRSRRQPGARHQIALLGADLAHHHDLLRPEEPAAARSRTRRPSRGADVGLELVGRLGQPQLAELADRLQQAVAQLDRALETVTATGRPGPTAAPTASPSTTASAPASEKPSRNTDSRRSAVRCSSSGGSSSSR